MLENESIWIKSKIRMYFNVTDFPMLNVGSSTFTFRSEVQPYIHKNIFGPLLIERKQVIHTDMKEDEGVDLVGDLNDANFQSTLRSHGVRSILCSNLLEHLEDPAKICRSMENLIVKGGLILVTVPHTYPYHKDPIDTLFRPTPKAIADYFTNCEIVEGEIVQEESCYKTVLFKNRRYLLIMILRWLMPFYKFYEWRLMIKDLFNWDANFSVSCVLLRKL